jgi:nanoRNase/pAp phosphatase (c-di-AMP/oligoRNAs hydrolase)
VIDISTKQTQVSELSYKKEGDKLSVYLKPKSGQFKPEDVTFRTSKYPHDMVVTIGVDKLESLGKFYETHAELFFETPVLNVDFRGANENFGQFNLVDLSASSNSEIIFDLISQMEKDLVDGGTATALLAGIIAETNSFQHARTTPQSFVKASKLVGLGADQQDIVARLFKNKTMGFLKLWGRVLARLKHEPEHVLASSSLPKSEVDSAGATEEDVSAVLKEMALQLGFAKVHVFLREIDSETTEAYVSAPAPLNLSAAFSEYQPDSIQPQALRFKIKQKLEEAEQKALGVIRKEAGKLA